MSSITDWLTSIGTIAAVVISMVYVVVGHYTEKKHKRRDMIHRLRNLSEMLYREIEAARRDELSRDITEMRHYKALSMHQTIALFSADPNNEDVLALGENLLEALGDYCKDPSDSHRETCLSLLEQAQQMK